MTDLGAAALYVPRPIDPPDGCTIACFEAREKICHCACDGKNHGLYTRPVVVVEALHAERCAAVKIEVLEGHTLTDCEELILEASAAAERLLDALVAFLEASRAEGLDPSTIYATLKLILEGPIDVV